MNDLATVTIYIHLIHEKYDALQLKYICTLQTIDGTPSSSNLAWKLFDVGSWWLHQDSTLACVATNVQ